LQYFIYHSDSFSSSHFASFSLSLHAFVLL
jgi:hypothetical protein